MDFNAAVKKLTTDNPDLNQSDVRNMLQVTLDQELPRFKGRSKYESALLSAYTMICDWLQGGEQFAVTREWRDLASFATHSPACVWVVFIAKARAEEERARA